MISVLMSVYRGERPEHLAAALESIVRQSEEPDEIVLVEDGPLTPELEDVIRRYEKICSSRVSDDCESRIRLRTVRLPENQGLGPALAAGMRACRGDLVARMDTDDIACRDRLRLQRAYMESHADISAVGGGICEFINDEDLYKAQVSEAAGRTHGTPGCAELSEHPGLRVKHMPVGSQALYRYGKLRNPLNHMTVMLRKADIEAVGGYNERPLLEDYDLWSRLLAAGYKIDNIPQVLVYARIGTEFSSRRGGCGYFLEYARLRRMQFQIGYLNGGEYLAAMAATAAMTLVPSWMRDIAYRMLRQRR